MLDWKYIRHPSGIDLAAAEKALLKNGITWCVATGLKEMAGMQTTNKPPCLDPASWDPALYFSLFSSLVTYEDTQVLFECIVIGLEIYHQT